MRGYTDSYNQDGVRVLVGRQGAHCGNVKLVSDRFYATEHAVVCSPVSSFDEDWLYYLLQQMDLNRYKTKSAQPGLAVASIQHLMVQVPELDTQRRISSQLKLMDESFSTILDTLKGDIMLCEQQLSLLRNQLLSIPEKVA